MKRTVLLAALRTACAVLLAGAGLRQGAPLRASARQSEGGRLVVLTNRLHLAYIHEEYDAILTAKGGNPPYEWSVNSARLPPGVSLSSRNGRLRGTPLQGGEFPLTFTVTDAQGASAAKSLTLQVFDQPLDRYRGLMNAPCPKGRQPHFYTQKIGNRWHLCTPAGHVFWLAGVFAVNQSSGQDYQGIDNYRLTNRKYAAGITRVGTLNWAYQTARRLEAWGFNATAEYTSIYLLPAHIDPRWPTADHTIPIHLPYTVQLLPTIYSSFNLNHFAPAPTKNTLEVYKRSVFRGYMRGMADVFDPNFSAWLQGSLVKSPLMKEIFTGPNRDYLIGVIGDEADNAGGFGPGRDFQTVSGGKLDSGEGHADPHWGWMTLISAPVERATRKVDTPRGRSPEDVFFADTQFYTKLELCKWLQQTGDRGPGYHSIAALNAAWGSSYDNFGSDGVPHTQMCVSGNGTRGPYTCALAHTPVTPLTAEVSVGGQVNVVGADDGAGPRAADPTDKGGILGPGMGYGPNPQSSITYSSGAVSLTFAKPVAEGTPINISYQTGGWGSGHGVADEDGNCPAKAQGKACWVPADSYSLTGASYRMKQDLDNFLFHFAKTYFATVKADIEAAAPGVLYIPLNPLGSWSTPPRRAILEAMVPYADLIAAPAIPPIDPQGAVPDVQARIDFLMRYGGDKPWINRESWAAQADSYLAAFAKPNDLFRTQNERGRYYEAMIDADLDAHASAGCKCGFAGTHPIVGLLWWAYYDSWSEKSNFGLATLRDDPYDGVSDTTTPGADSWGYPSGCLPDFGCEQANYGDFIDLVMTGNLKALRRIARGQ